MSDVNQVIIQGRAVSSPTIKSFSSGNKVANIRIASNEVRGSGNEKKEYTTFVDVKAWGKQVDYVEKYLEKGKHVTIVGKLETDSWEDKNTGAKREKNVIVANRIEFSPGGSKDIPQDSSESKQTDKSETKQNDSEEISALDSMEDEDFSF